MEFTNSLRDIVDYDSTVGISVVHGRKRFISLLSCRVPYLKFDRSILVQGYCLSEKCCTDRRFPVIVKLVFYESQN